ncbi:MAG: hypothetical protein KF838_04955 [Phycisphaeraceae bacterium]|nr:MAG: hypothetical protein KF838_04955 [Phycisphaeraceae bacterium]
MRTAATLLISTSLALAHAAPSRADLVTVLATDTLIVNHNDIFIACFLPTLTTKPTDEILHNSIRFSFRPVDAGVSAIISGNDLPLFPTGPFETVALCVDGGLIQSGTTMSATRDWAEPSFDVDTGIVDPTALPTSVTNIHLIPDGGSGYVGYATSDLTKFGYMQIQRLSLYEWRLVGYRYDDSGAPVLVENLIPAPATLAALALLALPRTRRRLSGATGSR